MSELSVGTYDVLSCRGNIRKNKVNHSEWEFLPTLINRNSQLTSIINRSIFFMHYDWLTTNHINYINNHANNIDYSIAQQKHAKKDSKSQTETSKASAIWLITSSYSYISSLTKPLATKRYSCRLKFNLKVSYKPSNSC